MDAAVRYNTELGLGDRQRQDQGYYNFLNMLMGQANSGAVSQGVGASARAGAQNVGAYRNQGNYLSSIWQRFGENQANIGAAEIQGYNQAIQGAISNWMMAR